MVDCNWFPHWEYYGICYANHYGPPVDWQGNGKQWYQVLHMVSWSPWSQFYSLTHWGQVTYICVSKSTIIASDNGLSPDRRQAIIWTNAGILQIGLLQTNFIEILIEIQTFSFRKMHLKRSSAKWWPSCLVLNVLSCWQPHEVSLDSLDKAVCWAKMYGRSLLVK